MTCQRYPVNTGVRPIATAKRGI